MTTPRERIGDELALLYGERAEAVGRELDALLDAYRGRLGGPPERRRWTERDAVLITYADSLRAAGEAPLATLASALPELAHGQIGIVHLLPFFPWTSDDGFSVADYLAVAPANGDWDDVARLRGQVELMFDAVVNHVSASSAWFRGFLAGDPRFADWFITVDPDADTSAVVRPRTLPLLTPFGTARGVEHVWTTFSADQIDLNYACPDVLQAVTGVVLEYVARGASVIRLDAVTYLWKQLGTSCIHLPQTHAVIRLLRAVLDDVAPAVTVITEANVPHAENISYFGDGDNEAQLVYNFALPPLVLHSFVAQDARVLARWASGLTTPSRQTCFFNFLASHDGVGVRGAEGLLSDDELKALGARVEAHGGLVGYRALADGSAVPYELNVNYFDALSDPASDEPVEVAVARFTTAQSIMLTLPGVPGIYVHSLLGSRGWPEGVAQTGANRTINREKLDWPSVRTELDDPSGRRARVLDAYRRMLSVRAEHACFDPQAGAEVLDWGPGVFALRRGEEGSLVCVHNVTGRDVPLPAQAPRHDLLGGTDVTVVPAWGTVWLADA